MKKIKIVLLLLLIVFVFNMVGCSKKESPKKVDQSLKSSKSESSKSRKTSNNEEDGDSWSNEKEETLDIPKTKVEFREVPDNPGDKNSDFTANYVDGPTFLKLKNSVTAELVKSIRPADNSARVEKKLTKPIALRGTIVTPTKIIDDGVIIIEYRNERMKGRLGNRLIGVIKTVANYSKNLVPAKVPLIDLTGNYIYPGFIDMHNHVHYNAFDLWKPTYDIYPNRNIWPRDPRYADWKKLNNYFSRQHKDMVTEVTKYGEIRGLIGGATTMQGYMGDFQGSYGLCRNVENSGNLLGVNTIRQSVMPVSMWWVGRTAEDKRDKVIAGLDKNVKRYIIHFCEGIDDVIREEYVKMKEFNMIREEFIGIHSTGLRDDDWNDIAKSGMKVVWSPLSNLMLYNQTTDIKGALDRGVPFQHISLAPDWAPSGSPGMLFEAKVVAEYNHRRLKGMLTPKQIVLMMTENPAIISGYDEYIGKLEDGMRADITVLKKRSDDPYKSVLINEAEDVVLTMVDGQPLFGDLQIYKQFDKGNDYEIFKINNVEKAIDITEDDIDKGEQTFKELMKLLLDGFKDIKENVPFEFTDDIEDYTRIAPLYWPKPTSYSNLMYESVLGKGSEYEKGNKPFRDSDVNKNRNKDAKELYKEYRASAKDEAQRIRGSRKSSSSRNTRAKKSANDEDDDE